MRAPHSRDQMKPTGVQEGREGVVISSMEMLGEGVELVVPMQKELM